MAEGAVGIAAPIFDLYGRVDASVLVSFSVARISSKKEKSIETWHLNLHASSQKTSAIRVPPQERLSN
jgi:DNA-binding IclR family transcriptional regulator